MRRRRTASGLRPLIAAALLGALAALWTWTTPSDPDLWPAPGHEPGVTVHVRDNGFHTDLALPRADLEARPGPLAEAVRALPPGGWILIGWGDARFYVDQSPIQSRLPDGFRAFFARDNASVVMLDPDPADPRTSVDAARRADLRLSPAAFDRLARHIEASLALEDGHPRLSARGAVGDARFFASREHFWIGHLCNHWTAGQLNAAGLSVRPFRSIISAEVLGAARRAELDSGGPSD